ncbi:aluminum activated malate transporter family protein [Artemisia annua]|uniref:Aluminum activated malate transporter family protein n=1 Tax=Artemisia annua TaxID=35608 RepID=A0A2U1NW76_ARTAN|nr:aluminum activated malate transporter family protein [Artemisia annua]
MAGNARIKERLLSRKDGYSSFFSENVHNDDTNNSLLGRISKKWDNVQLFLIKVYEMGRSDPRHIIFGVKSGLALAFVSILIFLKEPFSYISKNSIWAIFTVILVFEFSVGSTLSKGFNEALGAFFAAILALGIAQASVWWAGDWHEFVVIISIFIAGSVTSYVKMHPSMKPYEYGFRVSMLTFTIVLDSGTSHFIRTAFYRFILVVVGASIGLIVNICIYPIWSGEDLHKLVVKNFRGVAISLEECVKRYLQNVEYERIPSKKILLYQAADDPLCTGYRGALGFATWEPPHGRYKMLRYPWGQFLKVSGALRHCAFPVMAMHECILSEIQPAAELRVMFKKEIHMVGMEGAKVLQELGNKLEKLEKLSTCVDLLEKVHEAAEELQMLIDKKSHHLVNSEKWAGVRRQKEFEDLQDLKDEETMDSSHNLKPCHTSSHHITNMSINHSCFGNSEEELLQWPSRVSLLGDAILNEREVRTYESASALSLTNFTSSLIDFVARLQNLLNSFQELSDKARFSEPTN